MLVQPTGTGSTIPKNGGWYDAGAVVLITASPSKGHIFSGWIGTGVGSYTGTTVRASVVMNGPITEIARFT
jgi:hypothetical protein